MSINTETKINKLLQLVPPGTVILASGLPKSDTRVSCNIAMSKTPGLHPSDMAHL